MPKLLPATFPLWWLVGEEEKQSKLDAVEATRGTVETLLGEMRRRGLESDIEKIQSVTGSEDSPWFDLRSVASTQVEGYTLGRLLDAALLVNASWDALEMIDTFTPGPYAIMAQGICPNPYMDRIDGPLTIKQQIFDLFWASPPEWSTHRMLRAVAFLLRGPGNPDPAGDRLSASVGLASSQVMVDPDDPPEDYPVIWRQMEILAAQLEAWGLTWTRDMVLSALRTSRAKPKQVTVGGVLYNSLVALRDGYVRVYTDVSTGAGNVAMIAIPVSIIVAALYAYATRDER